MNEDIRTFLMQYNLEHDYDTDDDCLIETLMECGEVVYKKRRGEHRWWDEYFTVVQIRDKFIGYVTAKTTGDESASECGWEFDPKTVCEVKPVTKTITVYEPI